MNEIIRRSYSKLIILFELFQLFSVHRFLRSLTTSLSLKRIRKPKGTIELKRFGYIRGTKELNGHSKFRITIELQWFL